MTKGHSPCSPPVAGEFSRTPAGNLSQASLPANETRNPPLASSLARFAVSEPSIPKT